MLRLPQREKRQREAFNYLAVNDEHIQGSRSDNLDELNKFS